MVSLKSKSVCAAAVTLVALLFSGNAFGVAGFARQTGMTCNACHTLHGAPTPNFTFTGKKFNAMGYRLPGAPHHVQSDSQEQGEPEDRGEFFKLLPVSYSGRFQMQFASVNKPAGSDDWGDVVTNPTSRLAFFPFTGPIGKHFGVWTEFYIVPFTSDDNEWGIADTSYEEMDFRYIFNPDNKDYTIGLALSNQSIYELFGFGPFPTSISSYVSRGGVGGYSHPNKAQAYAYGWMHDRWVWALGADTGDTNMDWAHGNVLGFLGWAINNRNDNELWLNLAARSGGDALPLVTANGAEDASRSWQYRDAIGGISDTRRVNPNDPNSACDPGVRAGRRPGNSCAYIAEELDDHTSVDVEMRWGAQNVNRLLGERSPGPWSFEAVGRVGFNDEDYEDGAEAKRHIWGVETVIGWKHTYFFKPALTGHFDFEFTDRTGMKHDIDTATMWVLTFAYKPVENFLIYARLNSSQNFRLDGNASTGQAFQITTDISF